MLGEDDQGATRSEKIDAPAAREWVAHYHEDDPAASRPGWASEPEVPADSSLPDRKSVV